MGKISQLSLKRRVWLGAILALALGWAVQALDRAAGPRSLDRVIEVGVPPGIEARSTALFLTGVEGWTDEHAARAVRLGELHTLVIALDGPGLLADAGGDCGRLGDLLGPIARHIQNREAAFARTPVLAALADGADLALHAALAGPSRFKGLVTEGFGQAPALCPGSLIPAAVNGKAPVRWLDIAGQGLTSPIAGLAGTKTVEPVHGLRKAFYRSYLGVAGTDSSFDIQTGPQVPDLGDLPLTIHQDAGAASTDTYAIFLSGDGGWARFDEEISDRLAARGIPVVGISSLRYLWREKLPDQIARDLVRIDRHYRMAFNRSRVLLVGFSLGANTLPFAAADLPRDLGERVAGIGMIAPEILTGFEIVTGGWLGQPTGAIEVAAGIERLAGRLPAHRVACLYGRDETTSACPPAALPGMHKHMFAGGHHLGHDHDGIVRTLLDLVRTGV